jgi:hypothetical protein
MRTSFLHATMNVMNELIAQIRLASDAGLYYLALLGALVLPDICGALASKEGTASATKYRDWLRNNVPEQADDVDDIYGLRCSLLHQGRAMPHGGTFPIAFTFPSEANLPQLHNLSTEVGTDRVGWMSVPMFVEEVTRGAEAWLNQYGNTKRVQRNLEKFARLRPEGLPPHVNWPVIA